MIMITLSLTLLILSLYFIHFSMFISYELTILKFSTSNFKFSLIIDWISLSFMTTVTMITSIIMLYSTEYIPNNKKPQFTWLLILFLLSMLMLILSNNLIFILLGWDGLGLSSYLLVIFYSNPNSAASGTITILSNRIGDIFILLSISILACLMSWEFSLTNLFTLMTMTFLMLASCTKSAQFPFSAWLPAAMAAPTPISALVHSSTLVTAGVYLMIRISNIMHPMTLMILMLIASCTTIYSSLAAAWETDTKKIIALSTLSQIAIMMFAISLGASNLAFFHMLIHAMFKSLMFLCAGVMIHHSSYQDMRHMNMSWNSSPLICSIMGVSALTLTGLPFLSGFFSSDLILEFMMHNNLNMMLTYLMILSVGMTASYSTRLVKFPFKLMMKTKKETHLTHPPMMELPMLLMTPTMIFFGAILYWMMMPPQTMILPMKFKMSIPLVLTMGGLLSFNLHFTHPKFIKINQSAVSLWFIHFMSSLTLTKIFMNLNAPLNNDKTWQESYGPSKIFHTMMKNSTSINKILFAMLFILLLLMFPPLLTAYFT